MIIVLLSTLVRISRPVRSDTLVTSSNMLTTLLALLMVLPVLLLTLLGKCIFCAVNRIQLDEIISVPLNNVVNLRLVRSDTLVTNLNTPTTS